MKRLCAILLPLALAHALAACGDDAAAPDPGKGKAAAVQQGSISDAMIPLEQLESQGPLMPAPAEDPDEGESVPANATPVRRAAPSPPPAEAEEAPAPTAPDAPDE